MITGDWLATQSDDDLIQLRDEITAELARRDVCEHGVQAGDWCEPCSREYKRAAKAYEEEMWADV